MQAQAKSCDSSPRDRSRGIRKRAIAHQQTLDRVVKQSAGRGELPSAEVRKAEVVKQLVKTLAVESWGAFFKQFLHHTSEVNSQITLSCHFYEKTRYVLFEPEEK